jgi:ssRNA-specific RNase YbeY (16S rRNA maturation enzyme)
MEKQKRSPAKKAQPPRINIQIGARYAEQVKPAQLRKTAQATLDQQRVKHRVELTIVITGNAQLRALNRTFRDVDRYRCVIVCTTEHLHPSLYRRCGHLASQSA